MTTFKWYLRATDGNLINNGKVEAENESDVFEILRKSKIKPCEGIMLSIDAVVLNGNNNSYNKILK